MKRKRRHYSGPEKVAILKRHLLEKAAVSDLCDEFDLQPTVFYRWQKEFFENGAAAFERKPSRNGSRQEKRIAELEDKLKRKNEVVAELLEEHVQLKKSLGEL